MVKKEANLIYQTKYWKVFLADDQTNLGRSVVVLKRRCPSLSKLNNKELIDFFNKVIIPLEAACKKAFGAVMFNWTCLMNDAYKKKPYDPQVHWHFRPRYDKKVIIKKEIFVDKFFGRHYERGSDRRVTEEVKQEIIKRIRKYL